MNTTGWKIESQKVAVFYINSISIFNLLIIDVIDRLCGLVVRVSCYRSRGPSSIPRLPDFLKSRASGTESTQPCEYN
jgi:hypothetical protein